ncbi:ARM repeat-containing protein, partial [Atractiella rhizophila]
TPEILGPFLGGLLQHLVNAFNTGDEYLQEAALNVISSMAEVAGPAFRDFYPALAPLLFAVVEDKHQNLHMKAKALQTATCIAHQSSVEQMGHSLLDLLQNLHHTEEETETLRIVLTSFGQLAQALGAHNFKPYLPQLLPILLENAAVRPDVSLTAKDEADETEEEEGWIYLDVQGQQVGVQTTHLEAKSHALDTLKTIGAVVGNGMQPWLDQLVDICVPLLKFYFDEGIRLAAIQMIPILVAGYKDENSEVDNFQVNYINRLFKGLADLIQIENDPAILVELLQAWLASFLAFPHAISTSQVELMSKALKVQLKEVIIRADLERVELQAEGCPKSAEDGQPSEFMVAYELNRCLRELLRYQPDGFKLDEFLTNLTLATREEPYLRLFALRLMCDLIEFTGPACFSAISEYLPLLLAGIQDPVKFKEPFTRRVCSYGIGMMAAFGGDPFRPVAETTTLSLWSGSSWSWKQHSNCSRRLLIPTAAKEEVAECSTGGSGVVAEGSSKDRSNVRAEEDLRKVGDLSGVGSSALAYYSSRSSTSSAEAEDLAFRSSAGCGVREDLGGGASKDGGEGRGSESSSSFNGARTRS